ncbi:sodium channel, voltage-gated, type I, beta b [Rhinichthys klamathensis goyatoka]|uniref:sodium channel, voltage-gated, type I, beta b n=1 Tax=Rhinichthys klamathensis goyatoka TaxID=3034132 RepID=UPI0024B5B18E|nr:sodium channel, voltage-gated, type I, beta b [Rhinichthys klamathensis goyatoka]XP_056116252.1 sodium channel, voltage-gated, type I, beta b [Rhinichthys klamathensis goyatoka]XP_056116253.1 sodium channel, voltage-gated, type I, beta b [Rhinichthys klamathensis goyatoka]
MDVCVRHLLLLCVFFTISVSVCSAACAEVDSDTEAVAGRPFKLGCISCKMRGEVEATATVDWHFRPRGQDQFTHIYSYDGEESNIIDERFQDRMEWFGSRKTFDLQDASVNILNVTFNDTGDYQCTFNRILSYQHYEYSTIVSKLVHLTVVAKATRGTASIVSEVMMYVTIIGLQLWLLVEMIYCYRKIAAVGEEALRASAAEYLAIATEGKDNCAGVQVAE